VGIAISFVTKNISPSTDLVMVIKFLLVVTIVSQWHFILNIVHEMSKALEIRIFCVKNRVSIDEHELR
jgi:hypothetical protein